MRSGAGPNDRSAPRYQERTGSTRLRKNMADTDLTLHEEVLALVLTDRTGSLLQETRFRYAVAGAVLAELVLRGYAELDGDSADALVTPLRKKQTGDEVLDVALKELWTATRRTYPERWVDRFVEMEEIHMGTARELCRDGVLDEHPGRVRLVFRRTVYADLDPGVQEALTERVRSAVFGSGPVDVRTGVVAGLADAGNILDAVFSGEDVDSRRERVRTLVDEADADDRIKGAARIITSATRSSAHSAAAGAV